MTRVWICSICSRLSLLPMDEEVTQKRAVVGRKGPLDSDSDLEMKASLFMKIERWSDMSVGQARRMCTSTTVHFGSTMFDTTKVWSSVSYLLASLSSVRTLLINRPGELPSSSAALMRLWWRHLRTASCTRSKIHSFPKCLSNCDLTM